MSRGKRRRGEQRREDWRRIGGRRRQRGGRWRGGRRQAGGSETAAAGAAAAVETVAVETAAVETAAAGVAAAAVSMIKRVRAAVRFHDSVEVRSNCCEPSARARCGTARDGGAADCCGTPECVPRARDGAGGPRSAWRGGCGALSEPPRTWE